MLHILWSIVVGFVVGLIARAVMPGPNPMGFIATVLVGILGSVIGGFFGGLMRKPADGAKFHPAGFIMSVIGALIVLFIWNRIR